MHSKFPIFSTIIFIFLINFILASPQDEPDSQIYVYDQKLGASSFQRQNAPIQSQQSEVSSNNENGQGSWWDNFSNRLVDLGTHAEYAWNDFRGKLSAVGQKIRNVTDKIGQKIHNATVELQEKWQARKNVSSPSWNSTWYE